MAGKTRLEDQQSGIRSACQLPIHREALAVLELPTKEMRKKSLDAYPDAIRPYIEIEVRRIWALKHEGKL